ncbi:MAG: tetratricopeptide repeat protein [Myxococcota bacterium]
MNRFIILSILYIFLACATEYNRQRIIDSSEKYFQSGKFDRAYMEFESELDAHYTDTELHKEFIKFVSRIHRCEDAKKYYEGSVYREKDRRYLYHYAKGLLGILCFGAKKADVIKNFEESIRLKPDDFEVRFRYGVILTEYEMFEEARKEFIKLLEIKNDSPSLYSYLALCESHIGEFHLTRENIRKMLTLNFSEQDLIRANNALGIANFKCMDVPEDIKEDFRRILDKIMVEDRPSEAREMTESLLLKYRDVTALHLAKGLSLAMTGEYSTALYELNSQEGSAGSCSYFQYASGIIYLGVQKEEKGIVHLQKAIELDPLFASAYKILAEVYYTKKEYEKASNLLEIYLRLKDDDNITRFQYGRILIGLSKIKDAEKEFEKILRRDSENTLGMIGMGLVEREYAKLSKDKDKRERHMKRSLDYLNRAIKKDPENENIKSLINSINSKED